MQQCFHPSAKHLLYRYITPSFAGHSFRVKGETWYVCQFTVVHFDLISNIFLCRYASRTLRIKILTWCRVVSRAGLGLKFVKIFRACIQNFSITFRATFVFFRDVDLLCLPQYSTSVSEVVVIFLQLILLANTAAFFYSLLGLVSHCV